MIPAREVAAKRGYAGYIPAIDVVRLAPDGGLWIQRSSFDTGTGSLDIFDSAGAYVGSPPPSFPMPSGFAPTGEITFAERDSLEIERLVIARVVRGKE